MVSFAFGTLCLDITVLTVYHGSMIRQVSYVKMRKWKYYVIFNNYLFIFNVGYISNKKQFKKIWIKPKSQAFYICLPGNYFCLVNDQNAPFQEVIFAFSADVSFVGYYGYLL